MKCSALHRGNRGLGHSRVTVFHDLGRSFPINTGVLRSPGTQTIDIAIAHAEDSSNQDRIMDLDIGRAQIARRADKPSTRLRSKGITASTYRDKLWGKQNASILRGVWAVCIHRKMESGSPRAVFRSCRAARHDWEGVCPLRMADTFSKHCLVCSWIVSPTIFPATGWCGPVPETKTRRAARTAWLYVGEDGAFGVRTMSLVINFSSAE
jgi:hypothetical protein